MHENQSQTESLIDIVRSVKTETLMLPEFQRDFRWELSQTYDLFDSLVREIFIGTIIYGKPGFGMTLRAIDDRPRRGKGSRGPLTLRHYSTEEIKARCQTHNLRIVLDGQQRTTSIYRALTGTDAVYAILKGDLTAEQIVDRPLEDTLAEMAGEPTCDAVCVSLADAYRAEANDLEDEDLDAQFADSPFARRLDAKAERKAFARAYRRTIKKLTDLFKKQKLVAFHLLDMSLDKFCLFFERSNSRGIQLNFTDILAAKLYHGFNLREQIERFETDTGTALNRETVVRAIAYVSAPDPARTVKIDKRAILENLGATDFKRHWDAVVGLYKDSLDHLVSEHFILSRDWLPSANMVIPLMVFARQVGGFDRMTEEQRRFLEYWFWASVFANRYSTSSNEVILADCKALTAVAAGTRIDRREYFARLRPLVTEADDLFAYSKRTSAIYRGVLNLIGYAVRGTRDWRSTKAIDPDKPLDDHHIYPRAYIASNPPLDLDAGEAGQVVDSVVNRTLIPRNLNVTIGKRPPHAYLTDLRKQNPLLELSLQDHLVPFELATDAAWDGKFGAFLDHRAAAIMGLIDRYAVEPANEMIARHAAGLDADPSAAGPERLARGLRTPEEAFVRPILQAVVALGGRGTMAEVLDAVARAMAGRFRDVDHQFLRSDQTQPRWRNTAQWARATMVNDGLLKRNSPRGVWEVTALGRDRAERQE